MTTAGTYWRTLRHLKPQQLLGRVRMQFALRRLPEPHPTPPLRRAQGPWVGPAQREASYFDGGHFVFLNQRESLDAVGWDDVAVARLWRYNLHYFDDLNATGASHRQAAHAALVARWIVENPPAAGTGWEPYPTSLRIVNWIKWFVGGAPCEAHWLGSLALQARWLRRHIEWHLLGNHLFANAKALVFAGLFFDGAEAQQWLACGLTIIERELPEQVLADGGHFERSPMYHALALEDLLDLLNIVSARCADTSPPAGATGRWHDLAGRMLDWLRCMSHPDGSLGLFNDCAEGVAPKLEELEAYAARLAVFGHPLPGEGLTRLDASGYMRVRRGVAVALLDVAPIGPDYLPGHAHADTLSFELSLRGQRVIVNGGTSCYGLGPQRLKERGTAWHSTVQLGNADSSEVWSGFRVGRRARPIDLRVGDWRVEAGHDGYRYLPGAPVHRRGWRFDERALTIEDRIEPAGLEAVARFHLAPRLRFHAEAENCWSVMDAHAVVARVQVKAGSAQIAASEHAPRFGVLLQAQCLVVALDEGRALTHWSW